MHSSTDVATMDVKLTDLTKDYKKRLAKGATLPSGAEKAKG